MVPEIWRQVSNFRYPGLKYWGGIPKVYRKTGSKLNFSKCTIKSTFHVLAILWQRMRYLTEVQKQYNVCYVISKKNVKQQLPQWGHRGSITEKKHWSRGCPLKFMACLAEVLVPVTLSLWAPTFKSVPRKIQPSLNFFARDTTLVWDREASSCSIAENSCLSACSCATLGQLGRLPTVPFLSAKCDYGTLIKCRKTQDGHISNLKGHWQTPRRKATFNQQETYIKHPTLPENKSFIAWCVGNATARLLSWDRARWRL